MVPVFTGTIVDDNHNHSDQIDVAMRMLQSLTETYSIDTNRIYTTGQSMGGMTSFYESIAYPDFFAAYVFVGSQWNVSLLSGLEQKPFFYIVSAGDPKASAGQTAGGGAGEHMTSFDYAYKLEAVRDWLFEQGK